MIYTKMHTKSGSLDSGYDGSQVLLSSNIEEKANMLRETEVDRHSVGLKISKSLSTIDEDSPQNISVENHFKQLIKSKPDPSAWGTEEFQELFGSLKTNLGNILWDDIDEDGDFEALDQAREGNDSAVIYCAYMAESVQRLNQRNLDLQTILHVAAGTCKASTVRVLVTRGCDGALADIWGNTPLHIAAKQGRADVIKALTTSPKKEELSHPRFKVPYKSLPQDNKDQMNHDGKTPLHLAAQGGHVDCIKALAECKVDMDSRRLGDGYAALHMVIKRGDIVCLRALLEVGADLEVRNFKGETPQQLSYLVKRQDMVDLCVEFGASPNQLLFAETEPMEFFDHEEMDFDDDHE